MCYPFCLVPVIKHWLLQDSVLFPTRKASVVFCTEAAFSTHKALRAVEPNAESGALLWDVYIEMIHNAQYQSEEAILRWKRCAQHIVDLNASPCCRTCRAPRVLPPRRAVCEAGMSPNYPLNSFSHWDLLDSQRRDSLLRDFTAAPLPRRDSVACSRTHQQQQLGWRTVLLFTLSPWSQTRKKNKKKRK